MFYSESNFNNFKSFKNCNEIEQLLYYKNKNYVKKLQLALWKKYTQKYFKCRKLGFIKMEKSVK